MALKKTVQPKIPGELDQPEVLIEGQFYIGHNWCLEATLEFLPSLASTYHDLNNVVFEDPRPHEGAVDDEAYASKVALFPSMFSCGLRLPLPRPVRNLLDHLGLAPSQLHLNSWRILMCCCVLWR